MEVKKKFTPMMQQYLTLKEDYADAIVFFRLGDFYEMFFDDALIASKVLEIQLTSRDAGEKVPMCGIPYHSAKTYIQKLVSKGFKIAIAEQMTEPGKELVKREVIKLITPGMIIDDGILSDSDFNFIGHVDLKEYGYMLAYCDVSTGETYLVEGLNKNTLYDEILNLKLKEMVLKNQADTLLIEFLMSKQIAISYYSDDDIKSLHLVKNLQSKEAKQTASLLVNYIFETSKQTLNHLMPFTLQKVDHFMHLDYHVNQHLELTESISGNPQSTLICWLDKTHTAMGSRLLKYWLTHPIKDKAMLESRYDYVDAFRSYDGRVRVIEALDYIYDINRLIGRISTGNCNAKDLVQLRQTLNYIPILKDALKIYQHALINELIEQLDDHQILREELEKALVDEPPLTIKEGGMFKAGYNQELDELNRISSHVEDWLAEFEQKEREKTGIKNLKVGYTRVFGYYIEVSKGNIPLVQDSFGYIRKQTLTTGERYITEELKVQEDKILHAKDKSFALEYQLFVNLRDMASTYINSLQQVSTVIAHIDAYLSLAVAADMYRFVRPKLNTTRFVEIEAGRHPVVERHTTFVANHITMKPHEIFILTGPNMSGKSTYMRMFAVMVVMAQMGSFVAANRASLPIYDGIFTRIGSSDDISGGKSTFMVEMVEANEALTKATENSLILFDEIGRGTATFDGMALAQGMIEYIHNHIKAQMMFSTHYHELTKLEGVLPNITNMCVKAKEEKDHMIFLHQVERGASDKSYGIQVAALAHLPEEIIARSKQILRKLEKNAKTLGDDLFTLNEEIKLEHVIPMDVQKMMDELIHIDINHLTPVDALVRLKYLQSLLKEKKDE